MIGFVTDLNKACQKIELSAIQSGTTIIKLLYLYDASSFSMSMDFNL